MVYYILYMQYCVYIIYYIYYIYYILFIILYIKYMGLYSPLFPFFHTPIYEHRSFTIHGRIQMPYYKVGNAIAP